MLSLALIFLCFYVLPKILIDLKQLFFIKQKLSSKAVILKQEDYQKAGLYAIAKLKFSIFSTIVEFALFLCWIKFGFLFLESFLGNLGQKDTMYNFLFLLTFLIIYATINFPLSYYLTMVLDKKFGFSTISLSLFIKDSLKSLSFLVILGGLVCYALIYFVDHFVYWWIYSPIFIFVIVLLINMFYPTLIAPLFNKFSPLEDEGLQEKIDKLLQDVGFESNGIFVMDASKRDGRLNAYFGGLGRSKRVILFDTLLDKVSSDGLLAILGHELGHFKHKDILQNLFFIAFFLAILFFFMGYYAQFILQHLGLDGNSGSMFAFMLLIIPVLSFWAMPIIGYFSRKAEYAADNFGANLSSNSTLANALVRIVNENKAFPYSHPLYVFFHYTHPPLLDRLKALEYHF